MKKALLTISVFVFCFGVSAQVVIPKDLLTPPHDTTNCHWETLSGATIVADWDGSLDLAIYPCGWAYLIYTCESTNCTFCEDTTQVGYLICEDFTDPITIDDYCIGNDPQVNVNTNGCVPAYTFNWDDGQTTQQITMGLGVGVYTDWGVTVTDANGCTSVEQTDFEVTDGPIVTCQISSTTCTNAVISSTVTGGILPLTYLWNTNQTAPSILVNQSGNYIVTVTDDAGCTGTCEQAITIDPIEMTIGINPNDPCEIVLISLNNPNTGCLYTLEVNQGSGWGTYQSAATNQPNANFLPYDVTTAGQWRVKIECAGCPDYYTNIVTTDDSCCCGTVECRYQYFFPQAIVEDCDVGEVCPPNIATAIHKTTGCISSTTPMNVTITAPSGSNFGTQTFANVGVNQTAVTFTNYTNYSGKWTFNYVVSLGFAEGCAFDLCYYVTDDSCGCPPASVTIVESNCTFSVSQFSQPVGCAPITWQWYRNGVAISGATSNTYGPVNDSADYYVVMTCNGLNCDYQSNVITADCGAPCNCNIIVTGQCVLGVANAGGCSSFVTYDWSTGATTPTIDINGQSGTFSVTVTDSNGCTAVASTTQNCGCDCSVSIIENNCTLYALASTGCVPAITYNWNTGATTSGIPVNMAGTYTVTITDANGCQDVQGYLIGTQCDDPPPDCNCTVNIVDNGDCTLTYSVSGTGCGGRNWVLQYPINGNWVTLASGIGSQLPTTYAVTLNNTYRINLASNADCPNDVMDVIMDGCECDCQADISLVCAEGNLPYIFFGYVLEANAMGCELPLTYAWSTNETTEYINPTTAGTYCVTIVDDKGCSDQSCYDLSFDVQIDLNQYVSDDFSNTTAVFMGGCDGGGTWSGATTQFSTSSYPISNLTNCTNQELIDQVAGNDIEVSAATFASELTTILQQVCPQSSVSITNNIITINNPVNCFGCMRVTVNNYLVDSNCDILNPVGGGNQVSANGCIDCFYCNIVNSGCNTTCN